MPVGYLERLHVAPYTMLECGKCIKHPLRQVRRKAIQFNDVRRGAQPGELAFRQLARGGDAFLQQFRFGDFTLQKFPGLTVADAAHRGHVTVQRIFLAQSAQFVQQALFQHIRKARGDALVQHGAVGGNQRDGQDAVGQRVLFLLLDQHRHRLPAEEIDFHRALDALRVGGMQAGGGFGIDLGQLGVQVFDAVLRDLGIQFSAQCGIGLRQRAQAFAQCLEVQHGAADQQRNLAARGDVRHQAQRVMAKGGSGIGLGRGR